MELFIKPLLLLLQLGVLAHQLPEVWPWMIWPGCNDAFLLLDIQIRMSGSGHANASQSDGE